VEESVVSKNKVPKIATPSPIKMGSTIDGFSRRRPHKADPIINRLAPNPKVNTAPKRTEKAKTLLRTAVKKPVGPINNSGSIKREPAARLLRARQILRSNSVSRFNNTHSEKPKLNASLKVTQPPKGKTVLSEPPFWGKILPGVKSQKQQVFNHPLFKATNHTIPKLPKENLHKRIAKKLHIKTKTLGIGTICLAVIVLGSFFAYQNVPSIAMRVAASQAGFSGHLPGNIPAGFSFRGPIKYSKNYITLNYKSNSDNRHFTVTQRPTNWTSESLQSNFLNDSNLKPTTFHSQGLTVYIYNGGDAAWVDKGVWYSVSSDGTLSPDQILALAGSM
jgi:hypothetical protein